MKLPPKFLVLSGTQNNRHTEASDNLTKWKRYDNFERDKCVTRNNPFDAKKTTTAKGFEINLDFYRIAFGEPATRNGKED